jgi:hypothetical protein
MKKLTATVDSRNREVEDIYEVPTHVNHYATPSGEVAYQLPPYVGYVGITSQDESVWYSFGDESTTVVVPTDTVENGSSPIYLNQNSQVIHRVISETYFSLQSDGNVIVSYWGY